MKDPKVIGIGFHKTATTSLKLALESLGYRVTGPNGTDNPRIAEVARDMAFKLLQEYDAAQDNPWPLLFRDVDSWYPGSKFVLTVRATDRWIRSTVGYFGDESTPMREWIYGAGCPKGNEYAYIERYETHNQEVLNYFKDRPADLLVMDITKGDGWEALCPFLGVPVRSEPFPRANAAPPRGVLGAVFKLKRGIERRLREKRSKVS